MFPVSVLQSFQQLTGANYFFYVRVLSVDLHGFPD